jgi:hypothetical protein
VTGAQLSLRSRATRRTPRRAARGDEQRQRQLGRQRERRRGRNEREQRAAERQEDRIRRPDPSRRGRQNDGGDEQAEQLFEFPMSPCRRGLAVRKLEQRCQLRRTREVFEAARSCGGSPPPGARACLRCPPAAETSPAPPATERRAPSRSGAARACEDLADFVTMETRPPSR